MYLISPFHSAKFLKIPRDDPELWGCAISRPKTVHLSWKKLFWHKPYCFHQTISTFHCAKFFKNSYHKNPSHPKCIDLILTNEPRSFQTTCVIETGLSDFHLMTLTVMRKSFKKLKARVINYRSYKHFSNEVFRENLLGKLSQQTFVNNDYGFEKFCNITLKTLDKYAPRKAKHARGNQMPFMTKDLSKNIIKRSRLRNKYLKNKNEENRKLCAKQWNYCVFVKKN